LYRSAGALIEVEMSQAQFEFNLGGGGGDRTPPLSPIRESTDLFFGLRPSDRANQLATNIAGDLMRRFGVAEPIRPLHVSLQPLRRRETYSDLELAEIKEQLSSVFFEPFMLKFDEIMSFDKKEGKHALVLCCSKPNTFLLDLHRRMIEAQGQPGVEGGSVPGLTPHMTLFYTHQTVLRQSLETPVRWLVRDFHMLWSHAGECRHESLWQWPPSA
jgi:2'-5' RNA ligase